MLSRTSFSWLQTNVVDVLVQICPAKLKSHLPSWHAAVKFARCSSDDVGTICSYLLMGRPQPLPDFPGSQPCVTAVYFFKRFAIFREKSVWQAKKLIGKPTSFLKNLCYFL